MDNQIAVGLDLKTFSLQSAGIGRYTLNLVQNLLERGIFQYHGYPSPLTEFGTLNREQIKIHTGFFNQVNSSYARASLLLPRRVRRDRLDLFHSMDNSAIVSFPGLGKRCRRVATIHDLIVFKYPQYFTKKHATVVSAMIRHAAHKADHLLTVSECTKQDILTHFPKVKERNISVTYLAASEEFKPKPWEETESFLKAGNLPSRYFLSLGTQEPRKNIQRLVRAFLEFRKHPGNEEIGLLLVGGKGWLLSEGENEDRLFQQNNIHRLGFVEDRFLPAIYSGALAFVYPSLYEGFGLPVVEAMSCGAPIITSNISSIPEVSGDAALYVDPYSIDSIQSALQQLVESPRLVKQLSEKALQQAAKFSWKVTAEATETAYRLALSQ